MILELQNKMKKHGSPKKIDENLVVKQSLLSDDTKQANTETSSPTRENNVKKDIQL